MKVLLKLRYKEKAWNGSLTHPARDQSSPALFEETRNYKTQEPSILEYRPFLLLLLLLLLLHYHHLHYYHYHWTPKVLLVLHSGIWFNVLVGTHHYSCKDPMHEDAKLLGKWVFKLPEKLIASTYNDLQVDISRWGGVGGGALHQHQLVRPLSQVLVHCPHLL